jgi:hypothetical protein
MAAGRIGVVATVNRVPCFIHVTTGDGHPLPDVSIAVEEADGPVPEMMFVTGRDGVAQIGLPEGRVVLRIFTSRGSSPAELQISDAPGQAYTVPVDWP